MANGPTFTIGKAAAYARVSADTLRYYEREGLMPPAAKTAAGYRLYGRDEVRRLKFIRQAQDCGFTLAEIGSLLQLRAEPSACCGDVRQRTVEKKLEIEVKIKALRAMSRALDSLIRDCANDARPVASCPILAALDEP